MGYPRKVESLWTEADYYNAIEALTEEWARWRERFGDVDEVNAIYKREVERLKAARLVLVTGGKS